MKRIYLRSAIRYRPTELPPSPRDENFTFVTNFRVFTSLLLGSGFRQQVDCRGRRFRFSSRIFPMGDGFPDPLLIATSFAHLEFSYREILQWRICFACRLIAGAKTGRIFRQEIRKPVMPGSSQAKRTERFSVRKSLRYPLAAQICHGSECGAVWIMFVRSEAWLAAHFL